MPNTPDYFGTFVQVTREKDLYDPLCEFLRGPFQDRYLKSSLGVVRLFPERTDETPAPTDGGWQLPDVSAVSVMRHKFSAQVSVAVHTFEVKTRAGGDDVKSVFQALAYS